MDVKYTIQPGDFIINKSTYNNNVAYAIFEGREIRSSYASVKPDYSLMAHYETSPYCYSGPKGPKLEIATKEKPCAHKVYIIENPTLWRKCTLDEKEDFIEILLENGYIWDDSTWSLIDAETGEIINSIVMPKIEYNGKTCQHMPDVTYSMLIKYANTEAKDIYMPPPVNEHYHATQQPSYAANYRYSEFGNWED